MRRTTAVGDDARLAWTGTGARVAVHWWSLLGLPALTATGQTDKSCPDRVNRIAWAGGGRGKRREKAVQWHRAAEGESERRVSAADRVTEAVRVDCTVVLESTLVALVPVSLVVVDAASLEPQSSLCR